MYTCGITPYDATHLGHAATFIAYDVLQRHLIDKGHTVKCVRNVTDVDDPLFAKARQLGVHYLDLAAGEEARFERDMVALNALPVASTPRASSAIPDIRGFIGMVLDRGYAYQAGGVGVLRRVEVRLVRIVEQLHRERDDRACAAQRGGDVDDPNKRHPLDFVLWQPSAADEPSWDTMWGPGRPGWHIECSALALRELGTTIDLHGGGTDLIFPHHECERAQSEAATGEPFVQALDAHGVDQQGRREDVEEPRQPRVRRQAAHRVGPDGDPVGAHRAPLPHRVGVGRRADAPQRTSDSSGGAPPPTAVATATCSTRCASASTTTSTRPARSPRSTTPRRRGRRRRGRGGRPARRRALTRPNAVG